MSVKRTIWKYLMYIPAAFQILFKKKKVETQTLRFYKTDKHRWYVDYPSWPGSIDDLEMVSGADEWLDHISNGGKEVTVKVSLEEQLKNKMGLFDLNGTYLVKSYNGEPVKHYLWLCGVTLFVFQTMNYPKTIYYEVVNN